MLRAARLARQARARDRREDARAHRRAQAPARERAAGAPVRGDPQAAALGQRGRVRAACCASWSCTTACCRCSTPRSTTPRRGPSRWRRCAPPTSGSPRRSPCRRPSCWPRCSGARWSATCASFEAQGQPTIPALHSAMHEALDVQRDSLAIPRRFDATMKELWLLQPRFLQRGGQRPYRLLEHPRFRAAYDFFALRAASGNAPQEVAQWWERFQDAGPDERERMLVVRRGGAEEEAPAPARRAQEARRGRRRRPIRKARSTNERARHRRDRAGLQPRRSRRPRCERALRRARRAARDAGRRALARSIAPRPWAARTSPRS